MEASSHMHEIEPVFDERSRVLLLGTFPSPKSREQGFFYGHPRNRMWSVLAMVFDEAAPSTIGEKKALLLRNGVAMWDVLASCTIKGASDASITDCVPNDLSRILDAADIEQIYAAGTKASELYARHMEPVYGMPCVKLPSTSPANAAWGLDALVEAYKVLRG